MAVVIIAGDTIIGKGKAKIMPNTWQPTPLAQGIIGLGNYLKNPGQILHDIANIPPIQLPMGQPQGGSTASPRPGYQLPAYRGAQWTPSSAGRLSDAWSQGATRTPGGNFGWSSQGGIRSSIPAYTDVQGHLYDAVTGRLLEKPIYSGEQAKTDWNNYAQAHETASTPSPATRGQAPAAGAGPAGVSPNTIIQGQDGIGEEYRQRMNAYNNQATLARQALQGYDPSKGPLPGAAQEAQDQGMDIWKGLYGGTKMGQPGGAVGTFNPLMQARGDVPSMAELWQGIGGGAPTTGPSNDAIRAAMAKGAAPGGFYPASAGPVPTATSGLDTSFDPAAEAQAQQFRTAAQAGVGTESSTALQRAGDFVQNYKLGALNPNNYSLPNFYNTDYSGIFK